MAVRADAAGNRQLIGYVVPDSAAPVNGAAPLAGLREHLPPYMVPAALVKVASLPLAVSGKVDRRLLPSPDESERIEQTRAFHPPRNATENLLAAAWAAVFDVDQVSVDADFFYDLGGHSLTAARVVSELRRQPAFEAISILDIYQHPTVAGLAATMVEKMPSVEPVEFRDRAKVSLAQETAPERPTLHRFGGTVCAPPTTVGLYFVLGFASLQFLAPYLVYSRLAAEQVPVPLAMGGALATLFAIYPALLVGSVAVSGSSLAGSKRENTLCGVGTTCASGSCRKCWGSCRPAT